MTKINPKTKLTEELATLIRTEFVQGMEMESGERIPYTLNELMKKHNVAQTTLYRRARKENWKMQKDQFFSKLENQLDEQRLEALGKESKRFDDKSIKIANELLESVALILKRNSHSLELRTRGYPPSQLLSLANTALTAQKLAKLALGEPQSTLKLNAEITDSDAFRSVMELLDTVAEQRRGEGDSSSIH